MLADNFQVADKLFSEAIRNNPKNAECWTFRAQCHLRMGEFALSLEGSLKSLELDPKVNEHTYVRILKLYIIFGDLFNANLTIVNFKEVFPTKASLMEKEMEKLRELELLEVSSDAAVLTSDYPSALDFLEKAIQIAPQCLRYKKTQEMCHNEIERISKQFEIDGNESKQESDAILDDHVDIQNGNKGFIDLGDWVDLDSEEIVDETGKNANIVEVFDSSWDFGIVKVIPDVSDCRTSEMENADTKTNDLAEKLMQKFPQLTIKRVTRKRYMEDEIALPPNKKLKQKKHESPVKEVTKVCLKRSTDSGCDEEVHPSKKLKSSLIPVPNVINGQKLKNPSRESPKQKLKRDKHECSAREVTKVCLKRTNDSGYKEAISKKLKSSLIPVPKLASGPKLKNPFHVPVRCEGVSVESRKAKLSQIPVTKRNFQSQNCNSQRHHKK